MRIYSVMGNPDKPKINTKEILTNQTFRLVKNVSNRVNLPSTVFVVLANEFGRFFTVIGLEKIETEIGIHLGHFDEYKIETAELLDILASNSPKKVPVLCYRKTIEELKKEKKLRETTRKGEFVYPAQNANIQVFSFTQQPEKLW